MPTLLLGPFFGLDHGKMVDRWCLMCTNRALSVEIEPWQANLNAMRPINKVALTGTGSAGAVIRRPTGECRRLTQGSETGICLFVNGQLDAHGAAEIRDGGP
jgi:hypothetical protein